MAMTACETSKSSNPLAPTVAGPIPGVNITAPGVMAPSAGAKIAVDKQPITLTVNNASTNGIRPLTYVFEVATDANFTNKVFSRDGISPGDGQTSIKLPDPLATGRTYYWHARAQDGANAGSFTNAINFDVFTPIVIGAPGLVSPAPNATTDSLRPNFVVSPAPRSGPVGPVSYLIEVADSATFANRIAAWSVGEGASTTSNVTLAMPTDLKYSTVYYWHVRASDPTTVGPFSGTSAFVTLDQPVVVTPPGGGGGGGGGACAGSDQMNLGSAHVYNSPPDIASWAVTGCITQLTMSSSAGLSFQFTTYNSWPDVVPPGWDGPLLYTVWAVVNQGGTWNTSGFIQMWRGRPSTGAPILAEFARNWAYDARWGPMAGYQPHAGEQMGFFVSAGNARGYTGVSSVRERSNVVVVPLPAGDNGNFSFSLARTLGLIRR
ncbi:MAG TPA: hypothetical protein VFB07_05195 [Vicinamibacterales bacterium]|nr:hypothetical protein [Vicinamibacterales bacterium]